MEPNLCSPYHRRRGESIGLYGDRPSEGLPGVLSDHQPGIFMVHDETRKQGCLDAHGLKTET